MKSQKLLALLLLLIASTGLIFAQGTPETAQTKGPTTLSLWSSFTGGDGEFFDAIISKFNATHTDIQIKSDTVKGGSYYTKITAALAAGTGPDMMVMNEANLRNYVPNQLLALDDYLITNQFPVDDFIAAPLESCKLQGKYYAIPLDVHPIIMFANMSLLKKVGIDTIPANYDELIADAQMVQEKTGAMGIAMDNTTAVYKAYTLTRMFFSMMYQQNGQMLSDDNMSAAFNNKAGMKALQALQDMVNTYNVTPQGLDYDSSVNAFKLGQAAFHFNGVWATGTFEKADNLDFVAVPLPALLGKPAAWGGYHSLAISATAAQDPSHVKDILTCIDWITSHGEMWALSGQIPTRKSVQESAEFNALSSQKGYAAAAASTVAPPPTNAWSEVYTTLSDELEYAVGHNTDPQTALDSMEETVNKIIKTY